MKIFILLAMVACCAACETPDFEEPGTRSSEEAPDTTAASSSFQISVSDDDWEEVNGSY